MRVVGYVREAPGPDSGDTAFIQAEKIRRWVLHNGHRLVALCQDPRTEPSSRDGFQALLRVIASGQVDAVVVPSLQALSADTMTQEIMLADLRSRGVQIVSSTDEDLAHLYEATPQASRSLLRDFLAKQDHYQSRFGRLGGSESNEGSPATDLLVEILSSE